MLPRTVDVLRQFPFSTAPSGRHLRRGAASFVERADHPRAPLSVRASRPKKPLDVASDLLHEDYAYVFEADWDLWTPTHGPASGLAAPTLVAVHRAGV